MGRQKGDGRGRLGGRKAGTPNKEKPLKTFLREHSVTYFTPLIPERDDKGRPTGRYLSQYDIDVQCLDPADRVDAELKLLKFHTPQMQSTNVDVSLAAESRTLVERLATLAAGKEIPSSSDED